MPDTRVDKLFRTMPASYAETARTLRDMVRKNAPGLRETVKWRNPFWVGTKDVLCLQCYDDHVNLGVMRGAELAERFSRIEGTGKAMRHVKVDSPKAARAPDLAKLIRAAEQLDRQGR